MKNEIIRLYGCLEVYGPYKGKDARRRCVLYFGPGNTVSKAYARLLVESTIGRMLNDDEHVDHIDGDHTNDSFDNLQVLKAVTHHKKTAKENAVRLSRSLQLQCPVCGKAFTCQRHRAELTDTPCCTQKCAKAYKWRNQYAYGGLMAEGEGVEPSRAY